MTEENTQETTQSSSEENFVDDIREALNIVEGLEKKFAGDTPETEEIKTGPKKVETLTQEALGKIRVKEMFLHGRPRYIPLGSGCGVSREEEKLNLLNLFYTAAEDGYLTLDEIKDLAPQHVVEGNQLDRMVTFFVNMGARVFFKPPTEEELEEVKNSPKPNIEGCVHLGSSDMLIHGWYTDTSYRILQFLSEPTENNGRWRW